jgi:transcriptional regulator with XRE-family HTH domain
MKICTTSTRLKQIMSERNLRQVDIIEKARPFCEKYGVKLARNDLSQYVNGKVEPGQEKLTILGMALGVSEAWLMGYEVSMDRGEEDQKNTAPEEQLLTEDEKWLLHLYRQVPKERRQVVLAMISVAVEAEQL